MSPRLLPTVFGDLPNPANLVSGNTNRIFWHDVQCEGHGYDHQVELVAVVPPCVASHLPDRRPRGLHLCFQPTVLCNHPRGKGTSALVTRIRVLSHADSPPPPIIC